MSRVDAITGARVAGLSGPVTLALTDGRVTSVRAQAGPSASGPDGGGLDGAVLDAGGRVVLPGLVDAHVHLDKAYLAPAGAEPPAADVGSAIAAVASLRAELKPDTVRAGAERALSALVRHGTVAARAMVEIDPLTGLDLVPLHRELAAECGDRIALQLVAFPQRGLDLPGMAELLTRAVAGGIDVVGGCPYVDEDPARHLDLVFALAERYGRPVDLHLDLTDDPSASLIAAVAERTRAHGMAGHVTIGHVTTLAAMRPEVAARAYDLLAETGIALAVMPATDLWLSGHGEPGTRSLAPVERAHAAGVRVAITNNNIANPFAPYGNASLVQAAWLTGLIRRVPDPAVLAEAITTMPAAILGLPPHGPRPNARADLTILDAPTPEEAIRQAAPTHATLRAAHLTTPPTPTPTTTKLGEAFS